MPKTKTNFRQTGVSSMGTVKSADSHKVIAVFGNSGSFKTATSVNLAMNIAKRDKNLDVAIVGVDAWKPLIPLLFPDSKTENSLGKVLSSERIDSDAIYSQTVTHGNIGVLGYNSGENVQSYAIPTAEKIDDFIMQMRHLFNYTIIDCTSLTSYRLTSKSLISAENVLYLISCDVNGLVYHQSQESILLAEQYRYNDYLRCISVTGKFVQDESTMENALVRVDGIIPYCESIPEMWNQGKALNAVSDGNYSRTIGAIADEFMRGG
ncbi:MAG: hypothetical protein FWF82_04105 [Oscillospiraceae bacterium]|nr:hypothetical protein [Oscillospiraceae bacterium]